MNCGDLSFFSAPFLGSKQSQVAHSAFLPSVDTLNSKPIFISKCQLPIPRNISPTSNPHWPSLVGPQTYSLPGHYSLVWTREGNRNQGTEHQPNKDKIRYEHLEVQLSQTQMPRHQCKISNSQDGLSPLQPSKPITDGPEKCNIANTQDKDFEIVCSTMLEVL